MSYLNYTTKTVSETLRVLKSQKEGLKKKEVEVRQKKFGENILEERRVNVFKIFSRQFKGVFIYLLIFAAFLSLFLGEHYDTITIIIILFINGSLGFIQEYRAEKTVEKLQKYITPKVRVRREGKIEIVERRFLVPGDIVLLEEGDIVSADLRLIEVQGLMVEESILTGESEPVLKQVLPLDFKVKEPQEAKNIVFAGTRIDDGYGEGVVVATGQEMVIGQIAKLVAGTVHESEFEKNLLRFSRFILFMVLITLGIVFLANLLIKSREVQISSFLLFTVALAISVVPEALPIVTTLAMAKGALRLAKENVVVKRLSAIEDLGNIDVLCTDKTGTITENILKVDEIISDVPNKLLQSALATFIFLGKEKTITNSFDLAIFKKARKELKDQTRKLKGVWSIPFDPALRRSSVVIEEEGKHLIIVKGAPEEILKISSSILKETKELPIKDYKDEILEKVKKAGRNGRRVLALGIKEIAKKDKYSREDEKGLLFLGFLTFIDPLKPKVKATIKKAKDLGIEIKILTGDSQEVATAVAKEIDLTKEEAITGEEMDQFSNSQLERIVGEKKVFARVSPEQKYRIIKVLQKKFVVGFLGEGINDAPALKLAAVSLVVDRAADVAREAADVILLKKDLGIIIEAIKEGRVIFNNIVKYIRYTLTSNFGNFYAMAAISLLIPFLPMLPIQVLLVNLLSDFPLIAVSFDRVDLIELRKPCHYNIRQIAFVSILLGLISSIFDFIFFAIFFRTGPALLRTLWFMESIFSEFVVFFSLRTRLFILKASKPAFILLFSTFVSTFLTLGLVYSNLGQLFHFVKPSSQSILIVLLIVAIYFITTETTKVLYFRSLARNRMKK